MGVCRVLAPCQAQGQECGVDINKDVTGERGGPDSELGQVTRGRDGPWLRELVLQDKLSLDVRKKWG